MRKRFTQQMAAFDPQSKKVLLDYGFFRILPEQYDRCNNTVPERITFPAEHPVTHDQNRAHRTIMGQAQLQPDQLIMKVGNRSGVTFGKIMPKRLLSGMMPKVKTMECVAQPASAGQAVAVQGDSGAAVLDSHGHLVGIVAGGRREEKLSKQLPFHVCITPFQVIQEHLRLAFGLTAVPYRGYQDTQPPPRDSPVAPPHFRGYDTVHGLPKTAQDLDLEPTVEEDLTMPPEDPKAEVTDLRIDEAGDYWYHLQWTEYKKDKSEQPVGKGKKASKVESVEVGKEIGTKRFEVEKYCHAWFPACSLDSRWTKAIKDFTATQKVPVNRRAGIKSAFR
ncbi:hypothetical protein DOTSEDRAFT_74999 [Dothistroma septosporum NZE10]|uniref:Peptidase S1 domain-containing protein n=1 Tax=Dothistroma septosporum (strain NZE10 / CBS 128990) TaxID=675120 RepID=N1PDE0_DOTSN|nr:hypothetical protein DOTSEDRAFT_74999 [Dothistroma septosporum NZE10]